MRNHHAPSLLTRQRAYHRFLLRGSSVVNMINSGLLSSEVEKVITDILAYSDTGYSDTVYRHLVTVTLI